MRTVADYWRKPLIVLVAGATTALGQVTSADVLGQGTLSSRSIMQQELLRFTITLRNRTQSALNSVRLTGPPDSYRFEKVCSLSERGEITCHTGDEFSAINGLLWTSVPSGQIRTAWGYLKPMITHQPGMLTVLLVWQPATGPSAQSSAAVSLGENQVQDWIDRLEARSYEILKIFAIPMALAVFGFFLNQVATKRENRRAEAERERENTRLEAEKEREIKRLDAEKEREQARQKLQREESLRAETWKQMLPISHDYATKYYLPLSAAAQRLVETLEGGVKHLSFFYLLLLRKRAQVTNHAIGGLYFKDILGETLVSECWSRFVKTIEGEEDQPLNLAIKACMGKIQPNENYQTFSQMFENTGETIAFSDGAVQNAWELFQTEVFRDTSTLNSGILHLKGLCAVLDYEANRPYEYWYNPPPQFKLSKETETLLREIAKEVKFTSAHVDIYFKSVQYV
jgi:hypothetical protein